MKFKLTPEVSGYNLFVEIKDFWSSAGPDHWKYLGLYKTKEEAQRAAAIYKSMGTEETFTL